jgi:hypothetical protein
MGYGFWQKRAEVQKTDDYHQPVSTQDGGRHLVAV